MSRAGLSDMQGDQMNTGPSLFHTLTLSDGTEFYLVSVARKGSKLSSAHDRYFKRLRQAFVSGPQSVSMVPLASFETKYLSAHLNDEQARADYARRIDHAIA